MWQIRLNSNMDRLRRLNESGVAFDDMLRDITESTAIARRSLQDDRFEKRLGFEKESSAIGEAIRKEQVRRQKYGLEQYNANADFWNRIVSGAVEGAANYYLGRKKKQYQNELLNIIRSNTVPQEFIDSVPEEDWGYYG